MALVGLLPAGALGARPRRVNLVNAVAVAALSLAVIAALPWWRPSDPLTGRAGLLAYAPSPLAGSLRAAVHPGDRVLAPQPWASWFEWSAPDATYFVDSRIELFPAMVWTEYGTMTAGGPDARGALDSWRIRFVVVDARSPSVLEGQAIAGWRRIFEDADGAIYERPD